MFDFHLLLTMFIITSLISLAVNLFKHRRYYYLGSQIPGLPFYRSAPFYTGSLKKTTKKFIEIYDEYRHLPVFKVWLGAYLSCFVTDPDHVRTILLQCLNKATYYSFLGGGGKSLLDHQCLATWSKHRKLVNVSFQHSMLKGQIEIFFDEANILADKMFPMAKSGNAFESSCCVDVAALSTLVRTVFGVDLAIQKHHGMEHPYIQAVETSFQIFTRRICKPWLFFGHKERLREHQTTQKQFIEDILNEIKRRMAIETDIEPDIHLNRYQEKTMNEEIIGKTNKYSHDNDKTYERNKGLSKDLYEEMPRQMNNNMITNNDMSNNNNMITNNDMSNNNDMSPNNDISNDNEEINHRKISFVERILRGHRVDGNTDTATNITEKRLRQEMNGITTAGFDTVKITMAIILNMLAIHPEIQDKVYNEILTVCGDRNDTAPTYDQLLSCQLLTRVIKETVRMFPAASFIARSSPHDIQCGGYTLPAGASFVVFIYGIHRDPQLWPNPHQFDPDRFLPAATVQRNPHAFLPFSLGARNCIGYKYAMIYLKTTLSTVLRRYRVLPGDRCRTEADIRFEFGLTLRLLPGNDIRLEIRRPSPL